MLNSILVIEPDLSRRAPLKKPFADLVDLIEAAFRDAEKDYRTAHVKEFTHE